MFYLYRRSVELTIIVVEKKNSIVLSEGRWGK